jgi:hypothetical protein
VEDLFENELSFTWSFTTTLEPVIPPDTTAPEVNETGFYKANNRLPVDGQITIPFTEPLNASTIEVTVADEDGNNITGDIAYDEITYIVVFTPDAPLDYDTIYTVTISAEDTSGNSIPDDNIGFTFTTEKEEADNMLSPLFIWVMVFIIIIIVILIVVMLVIQRKREEPADADDSIEDAEDELEE